MHLEAEPRDCGKRRKTEVVRQFSQENSPNYHNPKKRRFLCNLLTAFVVWKFPTQTVIVGREEKHCCEVSGSLHKKQYHIPNIVSL